MMGGVCWVVWRLFFNDGVETFFLNVRCFTAKELNPASTLLSTVFFFLFFFFLFCFRLESLHT
jgi:hypothetical protein